MSLQRVRRSIEYLRKKAALDEHLSELKLVTDGQSVFEICRNDGELLDALREGQMAFFLAIDDIAKSVDEQVSQYLYDREEFIGALARVGTSLEREMDPDARRRLRAIQGSP
jgi:hypothetical protein